MDSIFKGIFQALVFVGLMSLRNNRCPQDLKFDLNRKNVEETSILGLFPLDTVSKEDQSVRYSTKVSHNLC